MTVKEQLVYEDLLGKEFQFGARGPDQYDCLGICEEVYKRLKKNLPKISRPGFFDPESINDTVEFWTQNFVRLEAPEPYCIVILQLIRPYSSHIGVVMEDCQTFLHILNNRSRVTREKLYGPVWGHRITGFYKWI